MDEDYLNFQAELEIYKKEYLAEAQKEAEKIYKQNIEESVYNAYEPVQYQHTNALENSVTSRMDDDTVLLYNDNNQMDYYSAVSGESVSGDNVVNWTNYGHHDDSGRSGMFHNYNGRQFIEKTKENIENEMPDIKIEIIDEIEDEY